MRFGLLLVIIFASLTLNGCWRGPGDNDYYFNPNNPVECTVAFTSSTISLGTFTEGSTVLDAATLLGSTTGGVAPFTYSGAFAAAANLTIDASGTVSSSGLGPAGVYTAIVTVADALGCPATTTLSITVTAAGPVTTLAFSPTSPLAFMVGDPTATITATGAPSGGSIALSNQISGGTGGSFTLVSASAGTFTYGGATAAGTASVDVTYTPTTGTPLTLTYSVSVTVPAVVTFFSSGTVALTIDGTTPEINSTVTVSSGPTSITDLRVRLDLNHTFASDLNITLTAPSTSSVLLAGAEGGSNDDIQVIFDDAAPMSITTAFAGGSPDFLCFAPEQPLATFDTEDSNGVWNLNIIDTYPASDDGVLNSWDLVFNGNTSVPCGSVTPVTLAFSPTSPLSYTAGTADATITATGSPAGGMISLANITPGSTGGTFTLVSASAGTFTYGGASSAGTATVDVTYTPTAGSPVTLTYTVNVTGGSTTTFFSSGTVSLGFGASPTSVDSMLTVSSGPATISDLRVRVDITHTFSGDMELTLTSPTSTSLLLSDNQGSSGDDMQVIFDDTAALTITTDFAGGGSFLCFLPESPLSIFDGEDPNGVWNLNITDTFPGSDDGVLNSWDLIFNGDPSAPCGALAAAPTIDQAASVTFTNPNTVGGTDSVLGSALSGDDTMPDFIGVPSNSGATSGDRSFVIPINSDGVGLDPATVTTTNVVIFELPTLSSLSTASYTVSYDAGMDTITVTIPGGGAGLGLVDGGTYNISVTAGVTNTQGTAFLIPPGNPVNSVVFYTAPNFTTQITPALNSSYCSACHTGGNPIGMAGVEGGIANPPGGADDNPVTLDFTDTAAGMFTDLSRVDSTTPGRTYISLGAFSGFGPFDPSSSVMVSKMSMSPEYGVSMPFGSTGAEGDSTSLPSGPTDPDTSTTITGDGFYKQMRSWIRSGAPIVPE